MSLKMEQDSDTRWEDTSWGQVAGTAHLELERVGELNP